MLLRLGSHCGGLSCGKFPATTSFQRPSSSRYYATLSRQAFQIKARMYEVGYNTKQLRVYSIDPNFNFLAKEEVMIEEAMEKAITLVTPENIVCNGKMEQNTSGNGIPSYSPSPSRSDKMVQSRYLKPSMASCHDNCKYGKKHDYEAASQNFRTFRKKNAVRERQKKQEATPKGEERRMRTVTKPVMETESKPENDFSKLDFSKAKTSVLTKKSITPAEKKILVTSRGNKRDQEKSLNLDDEKKTEEIERTPLQLQSSSDKPNVINLANLSPDSEADASQNPGGVMEDTESTVSEPVISVASTEIKQKSPSSVEKPQSIKKKAPLPLKRDDVTARSAILLKAKAPLIRSISHLKSSRSQIARRNQEKKATKSFGSLKSGSVPSKPLNSLKTKAPVLRTTISARRSQEKIGGGAAIPANTFKMKILPVRPASQLKPSVNARGDRESKITKNLRTSNIAERKVLKPLPASFPPKAPLGVISSLQFGKLRNVKHSTSVKTKQKVEGANAKMSEATDKIKDSETLTNELSKEDISKVGNKRGSRRSSAAGQEDNTSAPYKLKFRQGKVMDLRCDNSSGARRLWFRVGKAAGESPNDNNLAWRRSFRKKKDLGDAGSNLPNSEAQTVVLKHKEAEEKKKDAQALLNHVIEETASKLVDVRKSKVKALVGAFETVMSRQ